LAGHVVVEEYVAFGGISGAHQFVKVGKHSFIAGGTLLRKDVPPYVMAAKDPTVFSGINSIGLKRRNFTIDQIHVIQDIYRYIYSSGLNISQALEKVEVDFPHSAIRDDIVQFIRNSERGVIKGID
ncbi:MAG TPA: acyl-[acyl-carrier-protein]--UDP-N-acetylglucosamine O-acyltransferase, partial [Chitinophagaceae bacterium]|nr:acyl-[acyl-carrier-protein]--UDP-N-acetylglucosamine O-acyltransferase [Chitinophagaceae bacterium]